MSGPPHPCPLSTTVDDEIYVRGHSLAGDLMGRHTFTELLLLDLDGELPSPDRVAVVDCILTALMEHGLTPSTLAARLVLEAAPEALQGAIAAGLLATGTRFLGTVEPAAALVQAIVARGGDLRQGAAAEVGERLARGEKVPGLGHTLHAVVDPRVARLLEVTQERGLAGAHVAALAAAGDAAQERLGRRLVANAAGSIGAVLSDLGYPVAIVKGFAIVARAGGLLAHMADEMRNPLARDLWVGAHEQQVRTS